MVRSVPAPPAAVIAIVWAVFFQSLIASAANG